MVNYNNIVIDTDQYIINLINIGFFSLNYLEPNSSNKHILCLKFIESNNIKEMIKNIQLIIDGKYSYHIIQKIYQITD